MKLIARAALAGALVLAGSAHASDGTITITGKIVGTTCSINGSSTSGDVSVQLPVIAASQLAAAAQVAGSTPFSMSLVCADGAAKPTGAVKAYFETGSSVDLSTGRLIVSGGTTTAKNVQLQLLNDDGTVIKAGDESTIKGATFDASGNATLKYKVQYYATGTVVAGTANSTVTYSLYYQ